MSEVLHVRIEPEHKRLLEAAAGDRGLSLSGWTRAVLLAEAEVAAAVRQNLALLVRGEPESKPRPTAARTEPSRGVTVQNGPGVKREVAHDGA